MIFFKLYFAILFLSSSNKIRNKIFVLQSIWLVSSTWAGRMCIKYILSKYNEVCKTNKQMFEYNFLMQF